MIDPRKDLDALALKRDSKAIQGLGDIEIALFDDQAVAFRPGGGYAQEARYQDRNQ